MCWTWSSCQSPQFGPSWQSPRHSRDTAGLWANICPGRGRPVYPAASRMPCVCSVWAWEEAGEMGGCQVLSYGGGTPSSQRLPQSLLSSQRLNSPSWGWGDVYHPKFQLQRCQGARLLTQNRNFHKNATPDMTPRDLESSHLLSGASYFDFGFGPTMSVAQGYTGVQGLCSMLRNYFWQCFGGIWDVRDQSQVGWLQGLTCCTVAPVLAA